MLEHVPRLGFWADPSDPSDPLPRPGYLVDEAWPLKERSQVSEYLRSAPVLRRFLGTSTCRLCGRSNGSGEHTDGSYVWPEGLAHYVGDHAVRLPPAFVAAALAPGALALARRGAEEFSRLALQELRSGRGRT